jgi:CubicO group peptidase (beta-lactamase class C family)
VAADDIQRCCAEGVPVPTHETYRMAARLYNMNNMNRRRFLKTSAASPLLASSFPVVGLLNSLRTKPENWSPANATDWRAAPKSSQSVAPVIVPPGNEFMNSLPRLMELAQLPGLGMGVIFGDRLVWQHYAGVANASTKAPITAKSIFPAASLGKQIFAYAVLQLADRHQLDLDRPLRSYVREDAPSGESAKGLRQGIF